MQPSHILARDHLEQAAVILQGEDVRTRQLRSIIERTIALMDDFGRRTTPHSATVIAFPARPSVSRT